MSGGGGEGVVVSGCGKLSKTVWQFSQFFKPAFHNVSIAYFSPNTFSLL